MPQNICSAGAAKALLIGSLNNKSVISCFFDKNLFGGRLQILAGGRSMQ